MATEACSSKGYTAEPFAGSAGISVPGTGQARGKARLIWEAAETGQESLGIISPKAESLACRPFPERL